MITSTIQKYGKQIIVKSYASEKCMYNKQGFPHCHCDNCLDQIVEYAEFKKKQRFWYKGVSVEIASFCPLAHCCDIFIQGVDELGFCKWLTLLQAREELRTAAYFDKLQAEEADS